MRTKSHRVAAFAAGLGALAAASAAFAAVTVPIDQSAMIDLAAPAGNVVIGNSSVVDVSLVTPRRIAIFGRGYGATNVVITDRTGRTIFEQQVSVSGPTSGRVSVYRGVLPANFACAPRCERTPMPGEESSVYSQYTQGYKDYAERAHGDSAGGGGGGTP